MLSTQARSILAETITIWKTSKELFPNLQITFFPKDFEVASGLTEFCEISRKMVSSNRHDYTIAIKETRTENRVRFDLISRFKYPRVYNHRNLSNRERKLDKDWRTDAISVLDVLSPF